MIFCIKRDQYVYKTKTRAKYHQEDCRFLYSKEEITKREAIEQATKAWTFLADDAPRYCQEAQEKRKALLEYCKMNRLGMFELHGFLGKNIT